jgi:hypothetical protein
MNEREEIADIIERTSAQLASSAEQDREKIERGFRQSEAGDVVDGETFASGLLKDLDELEQKRRAG